MNSPSITENIARGEGIEVSPSSPDAVGDPACQINDEPSSPSNAQAAVPAKPQGCEGDGLSKKQRKRLMKRELMKEKKRQKKEERHAKARAEGRDLEAEQRFQAERAAQGDRKRRLEQIWKTEKLPLAQKAFQIAIDCSFESLMNQREIASLTQQLRYCYAYNKKAQNPCLVAATSLRDGSVTLEALNKEAGFEEWKNRLFTCTPQSLEGYYKDKKSKIVYLTSDSENTLDKLEDDKVYVIGGIVDRNRLKRVAIQRAEELNVATAKFPLDQHLAQMSSTPVLACNHVFDIMIKTRQYDNDWSKALQDVLPSRKDAKFKEETRDSETTKQIETTNGEK